MGGGDHTALGQGLFTDDRQHEGLAPIDAVQLCPRSQAHSWLVFGKAFFFCHFDGNGHRFPFGARLVKKLFIAGAVLLGLSRLIGVNKVIAVFLFIEKRLAIILLFRHYLFSSLNAALHKAVNFVISP